MDQEVRQFLCLETLNVLCDIARISAPVLWRTDSRHIDAELLPLLLRHTSLVFVQRGHFEETPVKESTEITYETQINQMHDIEWYGSGYMYCVKEKEKG